MMLRNIDKIVLIAIFILLSTAWTYGAKILTLNSAIKIALKNSPIIKSSKYDIKLSTASIGIAKGLRLPKINLQASYTRLNQPSPYIYSGSKYTNSWIIQQSGLFMGLIF